MTLAASGGYRAGQRAAVRLRTVRLTDARALGGAEGFVQHDRTAGDIYSAQVARAAAGCAERDHFGRVPVRNDYPVAAEAAFREPEGRTSAVDILDDRLGE